MSALFDEAVMKGIFEEHLLPFFTGGMCIRKCQRLWSKYRPAQGTIQAVYQVEFAETKSCRQFSQRLYLYVPGKDRLGPGMPEKGTPHAKDASEGRDLPLSYLYLPPLDMLIQVFPTDMRLPQLQTLVNPRMMVPYLRGYSEFDSEMPRITVLKYKPEKRCVIRYDHAAQEKKTPFISTSSLIGKTFCDDRGRENFRIMQFLRNAGVPVPEPHSYTPEVNLILAETLAGRELGIFSSHPDFPVYVKGAAKVLAKLHLVPVDSTLAATVTLEEERENFARLVKWFEHAFPPLAKTLRHLVSAIFSKLNDRTYEHVTFVHGELDYSQFMVNDSGVWLVDFDRFKISHPAMDVGRFLAYVDRLSLRRYGTPRGLAAAKKLFLDTYLADFPHDVQSPALIFQAMESIKIASRYVQRQKPGWESRVATMYATAQAALAAV